MGTSKRTVSNKCEDAAFRVNGGQWEIMEKKFSASSTKKVSEVW